MRALISLLALSILLFGDNGKNGTCWQRETIDVLQRIDTGTKEKLSGSLNIDPNDHNDFYFFTPAMPSTFDLIVEADADVTLHVGTRCKDHSLYFSTEKAPHVLLDAPIKESIYIWLQAQHDTPLHYQMHLFVKRNDENISMPYEAEDFATTFECSEENGTITCKR